MKKAIFFLLLLYTRQLSAQLVKNQWALNGNLGASYNTSFSHPNTFYTSQFKAKRLTFGIGPGIALSNDLTAGIQLAYSNQQNVNSYRTDYAPGVSSTSEIRQVYQVYTIQFYIEKYWMFSRHFGATGSPAIYLGESWQDDESFNQPAYAPVRIIKSLSKVYYGGVTISPGLIYFTGKKSGLSASAGLLYYRFGTSNLSFNSNSSYSISTGLDLSLSNFTLGYHYFFNNALMKDNPKL